MTHYIQLDLYGNCAHLNTKSNNYMSSNAVYCKDCDDAYVYTVCKNNIHEPTHMYDHILC